MCTGAPTYPSPETMVQLHNIVPNQAIQFKVFTNQSDRYNQMQLTKTQKTQKTYVKVLMDTGSKF